MPLSPAGEAPASASGHLSPAHCTPKLESARSQLTAQHQEHLQSLCLCSTHRAVPAGPSLTLCHPPASSHDFPGCGSSPASPSRGVHTSSSGLWVTLGLATPMCWFVISLVILFSNIPKEKGMTVPICPKGVSKWLSGVLVKPGINTAIPLSLLCSCPCLGPEQRAIRADNELQRSSGDPDQGSATLPGQESRNTSEKMTHSSGENDAAAPALGSSCTNSIPPSLCCTNAKEG